jgi:hypothetical protein
MEDKMVYEKNGNLIVESELVDVAKSTLREGNIGYTILRNTAEICNAIIKSGSLDAFITQDVCMPLDLVLELLDDQETKEGITDESQDIRKTWTENYDFILERMYNGRKMILESQ